MLRVVTTPWEQFVVDYLLAFISICPKWRALRTIVSSVARIWSAKTVGFLPRGLVSTLSVTINFSELSHFFLAIWLKCSNILHERVVDNLVRIFSSRRIDMFVRWNVHGTSNIFRQLSLRCHISKASMRSWSSFLWYTFPLHIIIWRTLRSTQDCS